MEYHISHPYAYFGCCLHNIMFKHVLHRMET